MKNKEHVITLIKEVARKYVDPAGREILVLDEASCREISQKCHISLREVHGTGLEQGIWPFRYVRNREILSQQEQKRLIESSVAVVGAGGLGGNVSLLLARVGIGRIILLDQDVFDETNLNRQAGASLHSLGKPKAQETARLILDVNPSVEVEARQVRITGDNAIQILDQIDVIVDALDNIPDRMLLQSIAKKLGTPFVHGALAGFEGQVMAVLPGDPGLELVYGNRGEVQEPGSRPEAILGVPPMTAAMVACYQAMEVLKILLQRGQLLRNKMLYLDLESGGAYIYKLSGGS